LADLGSPQSIMQIARGFWEARLILSANELRLFDHLQAGPETAAEVARQAGTDARATELVLNALVGQGLLTKSGDSFANTAETAAHLVSSSPTSIAAALDHYTNLWDTWSQLTEVVRSGQPALRRSRESSLEAFILAMHSFSRPRVAKVVDAIDLRGVAMVLDIGGGPGTYSCEFVRRGDIRATVLDFPDVLAITRRIAAEAGLSDRVSTLPGDALEADFGTGYDLIFISALIHSCSPDETRLIFSKAFAALKPGGQIVVQDFFLDDTMTQPPSAALFAINMLVGTSGGRTYSATETRLWLAETGFAELTRRDPDEAAALVIGRKP
jgi:SAM-dependent methyltransferase